MDTTKALSLVEQLDDNIEDLEEILQPLLNQALSETNKKLPVLERAKLHITIVYAIESLLFSYLKLNGVDAKEHAVFRELTRVKQYFEKIKEAENSTLPLQKREVTLDKQAALRMIKNSLAGNKRIDLERAEAEAKQKLLAKRKLRILEAKLQGSPASNEQSSNEAEMTAAEEQEIAAMVAAAVETIAPEQSQAAAPDLPDSDPEKIESVKRKQEERNGSSVEGVAPKRSKGEKRRAKKERKREREAIVTTVTELQAAAPD